MDEYLVKLINNYPTKKRLGTYQRASTFLYKIRRKKIPYFFFDENFLEEIETSIVPKLRGLVDIYKLDKFLLRVYWL